MKLVTTAVFVASPTIEEKLGNQVPLDADLVDWQGRPFRLARVFDGRHPVVLALVYYECPMLCVQALNGLVKSLKVLALEPGRDYAIVTVSFNPEETPREAAAKKDEYVGRLGKPGSNRCLLELRVPAKD